MGTKLTYDEAVNEIRRLKFMLKEHSLGRGSLPPDLPYHKALQRLLYLRNRQPKLRKQHESGSVCRDRLEEDIA